MPKSNKKQDYQVGYKKPPVQNRWQKGHSGNLSGRRKGKVKSGDIDVVLDEVLSALVPVNENGRAHKISKLRALLMQTVNKGLKGDNKAAGLVLSHLARRSGHKQHEPIVEEKADGHAKKEFEAFFNEIAANLRLSSDGKKQDNDNRSEEPPETKSDDKPPLSSEEQ
jgi:hypothetical protein